MIKSAEQRIKESFPDWKDWPEWAMGATVELVKEYGRDVAQDVRDRATKNAKIIRDEDHSWIKIIDRESIATTKIETP